MPSKPARLPSIPGLTERPRSIKSGKSLKGRVKICYRSDLYMQEQQKNVVSFQEQLKEALNDLRNAKFGSLEFHTNRVQYLKAKSDEMIIVLQVSKAFHAHFSIPFSVSGCTCLVHNITY